MEHALLAISLVALLPIAVPGQPPQTTPLPTFEAADVHPSPPSSNPNPFPSGGVLRGGRYDMRRATMLDLIRNAYDIDFDSVVGGPNWLEFDRYDVVAKAPPNASADTVRLMLQALLADRFKLVVHQDVKPMPGFGLTLGKSRPKLREAEGSGNPGCQFQPQKPASGTVQSAIFSCRSMTMAAFAKSLRNMGGDYLDSPVVDSTGLEGSWDFDIKWTPRALLGQAGADGITIYDAVDKQLGLKVERQKVPASVLVVDSVNEKPTDTPAEMARNVPPPPPAEFEVAVIKPSMPDERPFARILPSGTVDLQGFTLKFLIAIAWNFDPNTTDMLVGAPKFLDSNHFDVTAKAATGTAGFANSAPIDVDDLRLMLQSLLKDRFKLTTHMEDRPVGAYNLVAVKPKMKTADPGNRTAWKEGLGPDGKDPRNANPILSRLVTFQNMTMAQFADQLPRIANGYIHSPVLDTTGLDGAYDFTLSFSGVGLLQGGPGPGADAGQQPTGGVSTASEPNGALSLQDAIREQLGLKLEEKKRPVPVLVIDHVEEKPTAN
jgi:uncharacterized protein (TIGR03435 family)